MKIKPVFHYSLFMLLLFVLPIHSAHAACKEQHIVVLGDSLVVGFGLGPGEAFPEQLGKSLRDDGKTVKVTNAGVSGDTTSGGFSRLDWSVGDDADIVIVELGANDALRGIPVEVTRENLEKIITNLKARDITVIIAGMLAPPNMGPVYGEAFNAIYPELAEKHDIALYPFFLDGVAAEPSLNLDDGMHPNAEGIGIIVQKFQPLVEKTIDKACQQ